MWFSGQHLHKEDDALAIGFSSRTWVVDRLCLQLLYRIMTSAKFLMVGFTLSLLCIGRHRNGSNRGE